MAETALVEKSAVNGVPFQKGWKGGPGRPKGSRSFKKEFELCYRKVERKRQRRFLEHAVDQAFENDKLIPHILDRVVPVERTAQSDERPILIYAAPGATIALQQPELALESTNGASHVAPDGDA